MLVQGASAGSGAARSTVGREGRARAGAAALRRRLHTEYVVVTARWLVFPPRRQGSPNRSRRASGIVLGFPAVLQPEPTHQPVQPRPVDPERPGRGGPLAVGGCERRADACSGRAVERLLQRAAAGSPCRAPASGLEKEVLGG